MAKAVSLPSSVTTINKGGKKIVGKAKKMKKQIGKRSIGNY